MKKIFKLLIVFAVLYIPYYFYTRTNFEFDEAIHYSFEEIKYKKVEKLKNFEAIYFGDYPDNLNETDIHNELTKHGYIENKIDETKLISLKTIFRFQIDLSIIKTVTACAPEYNDIIIFKKDNKITGIAKICFGCDKHFFIGNKFDDSSFDEYDELASLLFSK